MAISCVYCGATHERADEVRDCWTRQQATSPPASATPTVRTPLRSPASHPSPSPDRFAADDRFPADERFPPDDDREPDRAERFPHTAARVAESARWTADRPPPATRPRAAPAQPNTVALVAPVARWAGPDELARNLVLSPDGVADEPWADSLRIVVDASVLVDPAEVVAVLRVARQRQVRVVLQIDPAVADELRAAPSQVDGRPLHEVGPRAELLLDELHHLVWSNSVVAVEASAARWPPAELAIARGAAPTDGPGDVVAADGTPRWLDGGSLRHRAPIGGIGVVPAISLEHGSLVAFGPNESSAELAPDQLAAVSHPGGAARIIAPAGSGKTRVLTERSRHLVRSWNIPPSAVTLVAYNRRAQLEMQERIADVPGVQVRTLNAIALAIVNGTAPFLRQERTWRTVTEKDVRTVLGRFVQSPRKRNVDPLAPWLEAMSAVRLGLRAPSRVEAAYDGDVAGLAEVLPLVESTMERDGTLDFDGQIVTAIRLLLTDPATRLAAQRACRVLLVDEFQDLTPAHVLLVRLLGAPGSEVFGVGDDDQTIYGYNGADPGWLIDYPALFPGAGDHPLEVNYRCPGDIVIAVDRLLRRNRRRVAKVIRAARPPDPQGGAIRRLEVDQPVDATVAAVAAALADGCVPDDVAVLARVNAVLVPVQIALRTAGIPCGSVSGTEFLGRASIRAALAWIRLATSASWASDDLTEAIRRPSRSLSPRLAGWVGEQQSAAGLGRLAERLNDERDSDKVHQFAADLERVARVAKRAGTAELVRVICDEIGLAGTVATLDLNRRGMNATSQSDDLLALRHLADQHREPSTFTGWLHEQLDVRAEPGGVTLATVHRVKGQEWPQVVVHLADEHQFPHRLSDDLEEERRIFHVALTRAASVVTVISTGHPSPFLRELDSEPTEAELRAPAERAPAAARPGSRGGTSSGGVAAKAGGPTVFVTGSVVIGLGLVLVDQGQEWSIESFDDDGALAVRDGATRRFALGSKITTAGKQRGAVTAPPADLVAGAATAFDRLRTMRDQQRKGKPAFTVFDDATLERIAVALPRTLADLARIKGLGPAKLEQYGDLVLDVVNDIVELLGG